MSVDIQEQPSMLRQDLWQGKDPGDGLFSQRGGWYRNGPLVRLQRKTPFARPQGC